MCTQGSNPIPMSPSRATRRLSGPSALNIESPETPLFPPPLCPALTHIIYSLTQLWRVNSCIISHRKPSSASPGRVRGFLSCSRLCISIFHSDMIITLCVSFLHLKGKWVSGHLCDPLLGECHTRVNASQTFQGEYTLSWCGCGEGRRKNPNLFLLISCSGCRGCDS